MTFLNNHLNRCILHFGHMIIIAQRFTNLIKVLNRYRNNCGGFLMKSVVHSIFHQLSIYVYNGIFHVYLINNKNPVISP